MSIPPLKQTFRIATRCAVIILIASVVATLSFFPWAIDPQRDQSSTSREFYEKAYSSGQTSKGAETASLIKPLSAEEQFYVDFARNAALGWHVPQLIDDFVHRFDLAQKKVLEVGAGSGLLQDAVADYTGLDISPTARRFFHKPFVEASATDMPFPDNTFDAVWSVWVLEHIPNPEKALSEMRRVVKPHGYLFLMPAFMVSRYAAQGYHVRPYSDFGWQGKLTKLTGEVVESRPSRALYSKEIRVIRSIGAHLASGPSRLHFVRLTPNYDQYWEADSDATTSVSRQELYLWFATRGDHCLNCLSELGMALSSDPSSYLIIQISKDE